MDSKEVIVDKLLCMACLCVGRTLYDVTDQKMQEYYLQMLREIPLCNVPEVCPSICCECKALLRKAVSFREQVKDSYRILQTYTSENLHECLLTDITRQSRFKTHYNDPISIPPYVEVTVDSTDQKPPVEVQLVYVKEENDWCKDIDDTLSNDAPPSISSENLVEDKEVETPVEDKEVEKEINNIVTKKEKLKRKKKTEEKAKRAKKIVKRQKTENKKIKCSKKETEQKIITVELSYEEMLSEREKESTRESYVQSEYKCQSCLLGFKYVKSFENHMSSKHSPDIGDYSCPICKTIVASVESFTSHYKRHMRRYECSICHKRTMDMKVMQQHYYSTHEITLKEYKCNLCGKISNSIDTHRYHKDSHNARVQCPECDKTFSHRAGLMNHRLAVHEFNNNFLCTVCGKVFRWKTSLKRHLDKHDTKNKSNTPAAFCSMCDIGFSSHSSYQRHLRNSLKHVSQNQLRFICDHCGRRFADKTKLRDHIEEKHLHRSYQCHICMKPSKSRVGLDQHIRNVHKGRPNNKMCHHCGKGFPTKVQLESHIRSHTGERPFICELCPTTFSQQSNLYKHNRQVHLNIKSKRYPISKKRKESSVPHQPPEQQFNTRPVLQYSPDRNYLLS